MHAHAATRRFGTMSFHSPVDARQGVGARPKRRRGTRRVVPLALPGATTQSPSPRLRKLPAPVAKIEPPGRSRSGVLRMLRNPHNPPRLPLPRMDSARSTPRSPPPRRVARPAARAERPASRVRDTGETARRRSPWRGGPPRNLGAARPAALRRAGHRLREDLSPCPRHGHHRGIPYRSILLSGAFVRPLQDNQRLVSSGALQKLQQNTQYSLHRGGRGLVIFYPFGDRMHIADAELRFRFLTWFARHGGILARIM